MGYRRASEEIQAGSLHRLVEILTMPVLQRWVDHRVIETSIVGNVVKEIPSVLRHRMTSVEGEAVTGNCRGAV